MTKYGLWDPKLATVGGEELFSAGLNKGRRDRMMKYKIYLPIVTRNSHKCKRKNKTNSNPKNANANLKIKQMQIQKTQTQM